MKKNDPFQKLMKKDCSACGEEKFTPEFYEDPDGPDGLEKLCRVCSDRNVLYIVQLVPELDPLRLKVGQSYSIKYRLTQHKVVCPTLKLLALYRCTREREPRAVRALFNAETRIGPEVFGVKSIEAVMARANKFFGEPALNPADFGV